MGLLDNLRNSPQQDNEAGAGQSYAPAWRWENPGDGVEGIVVTIDKRITDNHPQGYPIVTLRQQNGEDIAVHALVTVLMNEVTERNLRPGDLFAAIYDGKKMSSSGRQFHAFRVATEPGGGGPIPAPAAAPSVAAPAAAVRDPWATVPATSSDIPPF